MTRHARFPILAQCADPSGVKHIHQIMFLRNDATVTNQYSYSILNMIIFDVESMCLRSVSIPFTSIYIRCVTMTQSRKRVVANPSVLIKNNLPFYHKFSDYYYS